MATTKKTADGDAATPQPRNLYQRISAVMEDIKRLQKDKQVGSGSYAYKAMSEEKVATTVRESMIRHGLVVFPIGQQHTLVDHQRPGRNGEVTLVSMSTVDVKYKIVNIDNPSEYEILASSGTGVDPQDKGVGKAMTYAMKYLLMRTFLIPTGNDPDDVHNDDLAQQQEAVAAKQPAAAAPDAADYATQQQKEEITRLLDHPMVTREEKTRMLLNIGKLDQERAGQAITNLKATIAKRESGQAAA